MRVPVLVEPGGLAGCWVLGEEKGASQGREALLSAQLCPWPPPEWAPASSRGSRDAVAHAQAHSPADAEKGQHSCTQSLGERGPWAVRDGGVREGCLWAGF